MAVHQGPGKGDTIVSEIIVISIIKGTTWSVRIGDTSYRDTNLIENNDLYTKGIRDLLASEKNNRRR